MIILHDPKCADYQAMGHPESPARVRRTAEYLQEKHPDWEWRKPEAATEKTILRAHDEAHWERLQEPGDFDGDTPAYPGIVEHARRSAGAAVESMQLAGEGKWSFSLMRPPGHHACRNRAMGFCYLNSIAIAALQAQAEGAKRVAIFDFDVHHGNGTEDIVLGREGILYASVHQFPAFPGTARSRRKTPGTGRWHQALIARPTWPLCGKHGQRLFFISRKLYLSLLGSTHMRAIRWRK